jgi:hypothetical protein
MENSNILGYIKYGKTHLKYVFSCFLEIICDFKIMGKRVNMPEMLSAAGMVKPH